MKNKETKRYEKPKGKELEKIACKIFNEPHKDRIKLYCDQLELDAKIAECAETLFSKCLTKTYHKSVNPHMFLAASIYTACMINNYYIMMSKVAAAFNISLVSLRLYNNKLSEITDLAYSNPKIKQ